MKEARKGRWWVLTMNSNNKPKSLRASVLRIALAAIVFGSLVGCGVFLFARTNGEVWAMTAAERVLAERADRQRRLFDEVRIVQESADAVLMRRFEALEGIDVDAVFDVLYPLREDGTRRSAPEYYDGYRTEGGAFVSGMGAFIANPDDLGEADKRLLIAAFQTVHEFGAGMSGMVENFYFITPRNALVMYAPLREDRLEFYRETAPADFDFQGLQFSVMMRPENNSGGTMACTGLESVVYDDDGPAVSTACGPPVRARDEHLGVFGNSIYLHTWLTRTVIDAPEGTENFIMTGTGDVIAHRSLMTLDVLSPEAIAVANDEAGSAWIHQRIAQDGRRSGVFLENGQIVSFARINAPGWYYVNVRPVSAITTRAMGIGMWAAGLAALMVILGALALAAAGLTVRNALTGTVRHMTSDFDPDGEPVMR